MTQPDDTPEENVNEPPEPVVVPGLTPLEVAFYGLVLAAITRWLGAVADKILAPWRRFRMPADTAAFWSEQPLWNDEVDGLIRWLDEHPAAFGWDRFDRGFPGDLGPYPSNDAFVAAHLAQVRNLLVRIPQETFDKIIAEIADGHNEGENFEDIAARIENVLTVTGSENWPNRARVISVTEVNGAANAGWFGAAVQTQEMLGTPLDKGWLNSHDNNVRSEHRDVKPVPLLEPFIVGGFPMMYCGDKSAPPHLVINCRCAMTTKERP